VVTEEVGWFSNDRVTISKSGVIQALAPGVANLWVEYEEKKFSPPPPSTITVAGLPQNSLVISGTSHVEALLPYTKQGEDPAFSANVAWGAIPVPTRADPRSPSGRAYPFVQISACGTWDRKILRHTCSTKVLSCANVFDSATNTCTHKADGGKFFMPVSDFVRNEGVTDIDGVIVFQSDYLDVTNREKFITDDDMRIANVVARTEKAIRLRFY